ncbi:MAG: hypothetical protein DHS20C12_04460 [Pseudohongiella sp.]|nr:MAG: hypothetical protein DHS20C12_04460 [Pseudohongiella sp.]
MIKPFYDIYDQYSARATRTLSILLLVVCSQISLAAGPVSSDTAQVGEVTIVLGKAYLENSASPRTPITRGSTIRVSDSIYTESNGHVHIRFVDGGLVSVRPGSRLDVVRYDYDKASPEQSSVKFSLHEGVTRSISGDAAKSARQRFRLNTPIAAIGVRGTDFVVSATDRTTRALVNEGAIVLAPYSDQCSVASFGPCDLNAVELTDNSLQIIEFDNSAPSPRLLAAPHERDPSALRDEVQLALADSGDETDSESGDKTVTTEVYLESVTPNRVTQEAANAIPAIAAAADFTPSAPVAAVELTSRQLVWGRWADDQLDAQRITLAYTDAKLGRAVTVGNDDNILFRNEDRGSRVDRGLGVVSFELNSAQAFYSSDSGIVAMQVDSGNLDIDFDGSEFATTLGLSHSLTGSVNFNASGTISDGGYFNSRNESQRIAGAVSIDGQEAGYFFERQLLDGGIQGLTLWDAR